MQKPLPARTTDQGVASWVVGARDARRLLANAFSVAATGVMTSAVGYVFWWVVARTSEPSETGRAASEVSAILLLSSVITLGTGTYFVARISRGQASRQLILGGAVRTFAIAFTAGLLFAVVAKGLAGGRVPAPGTPVDAIALALAVGLVALGTLADQALLGLLRAECQLLRNLIFAATKLVLLVTAGVVAGSTTAATVVATWAAAAAISLVFVLAWTRSRIQMPTRSSEVSTATAPMRAHYALNLALSVPGLLLPLVAAAFVSTAASAQFYIAWMMAGVVFIGPVALAAALFPTAARMPAQLPERLRLTLAASAVVGVAGVAFWAVAAGKFLAVFGPTYAANASILPILTLAVFPATVKEHYAALARTQERVGAAARICLLGACLEIVGAIVGAATSGLSGLAAGWVVAVYFASILFAPSVLRSARGVDLTTALAPHTDVLSEGATNL